MPPRAQLPPKDRAARSRLIHWLSAAAQPLARASLVTMARTCGKKGCKCAQGERHVSLYLASRIIEAHGGKIEVRSREGEGTEFIVQVPGG